MTMTARFDDWEGQYLAHFRTKGSKNGVRRYQTESGEWTPLGLRERAKREGWGDGEMQARRAARAERRAAASAARKERIAAYKEERRKNNPKTMTDAELRNKIARAKLEQEYKELTRSPLLKTGEKLITGYLGYRAKKEERQQEKEKNAMDIAKMRTEITKSKELTKQKRYDAQRAEFDASNSKAQAERARITKKRDLINSKIAYKATTVRGGVAKMLNKALSGLGEGKATLHKGRAELRIGNAKSKAERHNIVAKAATELKVDTARWNAETKKGARFINEVFRTRERVDKYNKNLKPHQTRMEQDPNEWNRRKNSF